MTNPSAQLGHVAVNTPDLDRFRRFYEDIIGLRLVATDRPPGAPFRRLGIFTDRRETAAVLLAFEVPGYDSGMPDDVLSRRGRIDHLAFTTDSAEEFADLVERLVDAGASSGEVSSVGPTKSVLFIDPDGGHHNLQIFAADWQPPSTAEIIAPDLLRIMRPASS